MPVAAEELSPATWAPLYSVASRLDQAGALALVRDLFFICGPQLPTSVPNAHHPLPARMTKRNQAALPNANSAPSAATLLTIAFTIRSRGLPSV